MSVLDGRVAIVTGAGRGIGRSIALAYAAEGAAVVVASLGKEESELTVRDIEAGGGRAIAVPTNVGHREDVIAMVAAAVESFGRLDILVNNAQSFGTQSAPTPAPMPCAVQDYDLDEIEWTFTTGYRASLWAMQAAYPHFKRNGRGKVINFASVFGLLGAEGTLAYNSTKEAIRALTRTAAREWAKERITVNVMAPAAKTDTAASMERENPEIFYGFEEKIPMGYFGDPLREVAPTAVFLAAEASDYMTGQTINIDGGSYIAP